MKKYSWKPLSQWDVPKPEFYTQCKRVKTGLSEAICEFLLVEEIDLKGDGYIRTQPINKADVTEYIGRMFCAGLKT